MKLGMIGTGRIARRFFADAKKVHNVRITAVHNPHAQSAERFLHDMLQENGPEGINTCLATQDPKNFFDQVDAVYIASPHETHFSYIMESLRRGKHVLCEKPMCLRESEAKEAYAFAASNGLVLMEAVKTAYCPGFLKLLEVAKSGLIGEIRNVEACFTKLEDPGKRELKDLQFGGSFTELGSYVLLPALSLLGTDFSDIRFDSIRNGDGIDLFTRALLTYQDALATLTCGLGVKSEGRLLISGTKGYLAAEAPWWKTKHFEAHFEDVTRVEVFDMPFEGDGLCYELERFAKTVKTGERSGQAEKVSVCMAGCMEKFLTHEGILFFGN